MSQEPTYLSPDVWKALWLLAKSGKFDNNIDGMVGVLVTTPDKLADDILRSVLTLEYPQLFEHQKKVAEMEKEILKRLQ